MIKSMTLENFRGISGTYSFTKENRLLGKNGTGKSSIKEAVAFAFTGADSSGNKAPVHLIAWGASGCRVDVQTDKAVISRTLTGKKSSTLKLYRGEVATNLSQTQFEQMLGLSSDLFMAIFTPGYFWTMPLARQQAVLSEVTPQFDIDGFIEHFIQRSLEEAEQIKFGFAKKRPDIVAGVIANERRDLQRQIDFNSGKIQATERPIADMSEPIRPEGAEEELKAIELLKAAGANYRSKLSAYNTVKQAFDVTTQTNQMRRARLAEINQEVSQLPSKPFLPLDGFPKEKAEELTALRASFKSKPQPPQLVTEVGSDSCPTCGQVVGLKHKDRVRAENNKRLVEYEAVVKEVEVFNAATQRRINVLLKEEEAHRVTNLKTEEAHNNIRRRKSQLEGEASGLTDLPIPALPPVPEFPSQECNRAREDELRSMVEHYRKSVGEYQFSRQLIMEQTTTLADLRRSVEPLMVARDRLAKLEEALKAVPAAKLQHQTAAFVMPGFTLTQDESAVSLVRNEDGCPQQLLSTGQAVNANILFSIKLNQLAKRPAGVMFIDNADLVDAFVNELYDLQVFEAYVYEEKAVLEVVNQ